MATLRHQQRLHNKQLLLQHLVNDSLCSFPWPPPLVCQSAGDAAKPGIQDLVDYFCQDMTDRLCPPSSLAGRIRRHKKDSVVYRLAKMLMSGQYDWLEEGIIPVLRNDTAARNMNSSNPTDLSAGQSNVDQARQNAQRLRRQAVIVSAVRTPMGSFNGVFGSVPATKLGSIAIAEASSAFMCCLNTSMMC